MSTQNLTPYRDRVSEVLSEAFLFIVPDSLPRLLRPIASRNKTKCAITGRAIYPGDFAYPCHENPVRLAPTGKARCIINEAHARGSDIIPEGIIAVRVPTADDIMKSLPAKQSKVAYQKQLTKEATRLIAAAR